MSAFLTRIFMAAVLFTAVLAHPKNNHKSKCAKHEFFFAERGLCLPYGGPSDHPKAPKPFKCPAYGWAWAKQLHGCVPTFPPQYAPQCPPGYEWCPPEWACKPVPTGPKPPAPKPSKKAGTHKSTKRVQIALPRKCAVGLDACPIPGADGLSGDFECLDTTTELESCGGCASLGEGTDCTAIPHALNVACKVGKCEVSSCKAGYKLSPIGNICIPA